MICLAALPWTDTSTYTIVNHKISIGGIKICVGHWLFQPRTQIIPYQCALMSSLLLVRYPRLLFKFAKYVGVLVL